MSPRIVGEARTAREYFLEQIDDAAVVQLYADGFADLSKTDKVLVWHLYNAAIAGRDIYYDQRHRHNLALRDILEAIVTHADGVPEESLAEITRYTKLFWLNTGPYNNLTARKFVLQLPPEELVHAAECAWRNGALFNLSPGETIEALIHRYAAMFFEVDYEPLLTCKSPGEGRDILQQSANNLYEGVTSADLEGFEERYPLNSRLVNLDGSIVEEVYRIGGRYHDEISAIVEHLDRAVRFAPEQLARALRALIRWYETGEEEDREAFEIAWVQNSESTVDTMNGFIEVYLDARGFKGAWEGLVYYVNGEKTGSLRRLASHAQWFEDHLPIDPRYRKPYVHGVSATAIEVVVETGDSGPITPVGINLPNDQRIREQYGSKSVSLANVMETHEKSTPQAFRQEFAWSREEVERAERWGALASELTTAIHEVLGHGSGRMADGIDQAPQELLKEQYSTLEEMRADLVALYFLADRHLGVLGIVPPEEQAEIVRTEYEAYARNALLQLRRVRGGTTLEEDHMRNRQAIVHWLMAHTRAIEVRRRDGNTYQVVTDPEAFRSGVAHLLAEVQRIKSEGDYAAGRALIEAYGVHFDPALRDEVVARVDRLRLPSYSGFVMPRLESQQAPDGEIEDVAISYPCNLTTQMLEYSAPRRARLQARMAGQAP